jgi:hypothetical protein
MIVLLEIRLCADLFQEAANKQVEFIGLAFRAFMKLQFSHFMIQDIQNRLFVFFVPTLHRLSPVITVLLLKDIHRRPSLRTSLSKQLTAYFHRFPRKNILKNPCNP